jgi:hypothetical protein
MRVRTILALAMTAGFAGPALAHHSGAMFDSGKEVTLKGVIKVVQLTNPHSWIQVLVPDAAGKPVEWSLEAAAPTVLIRGGIKKNTLKPGDEITFRAHPMKDGRPGASLIDLTTADGSVLPRKAARPSYD